MAYQTAHDKRGNIVEPGDFVRLLAIRPSIVQQIYGVEPEACLSMINQIVEIYNVSEEGSVCVCAKHRNAYGRFEYHSISVDPEGIELVAKNEDI